MARNPKPYRIFTLNKWKMIVFPKAKINLGLRITRKRSDGYHDIETLFYPINLREAIEFVVSPAPVNKDTLTVTGIDTGSRPEDNLVIMTLNKLREKYSFPYLKILLHKTIPVGAGLGGGSSDAAFLLKGVNKFFNLSIDQENLKATALELGSDCPFFIDSVPAFATGRGEELKPISPVLAGYYIVLVNPGKGINTREAFQQCIPADPSTDLVHLIESPVNEWKDLIFNDFENFAINKHPAIGELKKELYSSGAFFSLMSGSGSSVYGLFTRKPELPDKLKELVIFEGEL
jgi:4-diphosphocytidyl-2-C-methyl-D-erythritol kinase